MITNYEFGKITISNNDYYEDVIVSWQGKVLIWRREQSHNVSEKDIKKILYLKPDILVVGTGESGMMKVLPETEELVINNDIGLVVQKTPEAISFFNKSIKENKKILGLFHLTC